MDDSSQKDLESSWVIVDPVGFAEEAVELDTGSELQKRNDQLESDLESDGISVISESSHLHETTTDETNTDEEHFYDSENSGEGGVEKEKQATGEDMCHSGSVKWTFVNSEVAHLESPLSEGSSKQFYLNCLQEPVQELSEHELGSVQSDAESDSISIISECESLDDNQLSLEVRMLSMDSTKLQIVSKNPPSGGTHKYFNGLMIGTILLASGSIFLGQYLNINDLISDIKAYGHDVSSEYNVPTLLTFCKNKHKGDGINIQNNINKCLRKIEKHMQRKKSVLEKYKHVQNMDKHLKIKEHYLSEKEKFLIKKEHELLKVEMKLKKRQLKKYQNTKAQKNLLSHHHINIAANKISKIENERSDFLNSKGDIGVSKKHSHLKKKLELKDKNKDRKFLDSYHVHKKPEFQKIKNSEHNEETTKFSDNLNENKPKFKAEKDNIPKKNVYIKKKEKDNKHKLKSRTKNGIEKNYQRGTNYLILQNGDNETISGYWVGKLYKARSDLRNKEHLGDWYFDRASYREKKRDKANWYFDWMMDREILRYKRSYFI